MFAWRRHRSNAESTVWRYDRNKSTKHGPKSTRVITEKCVTLIVHKIQKGYNRRVVYRDCLARFAGQLETPNVPGICDTWMQLSVSKERRSTTTAAAIDNDAAAVDSVGSWRNRRWIHSSCPSHCVRISAMTTTQIGSIKTANFIVAYDPWYPTEIFKQASLSLWNHFLYTQHKLHMNLAVFSQHIATIS